MDPPNQITLCLQRLRRGDAAAADEMLPLVYEQLRYIAGQLMRPGQGGQTLQPTALVHEAWLKIQKGLGGGDGYHDRTHFLAVAARAMRQILVNRARDRRAQKRGGGAPKLPLDECIEQIEQQTGDLVELSDLLLRLADEDPRQAQVVEMRVFGGLSIEEVAEALDLAPSTVKLDWRFARAWLQRQLRGGDGD